MADQVKRVVVIGGANMDICGSPAGRLVLRDSNPGVVTVRPGDRVTLCWDPGRRCTVEYLGSNAYRVVSSERTKLKPGNTFQTAFFATGSPLILSNLVQDDSFATLYEIGRKTGVTQLTLETVK